jgi:hypothetical protein
LGFFSSSIFCVVAQLDSSVIAKINKIAFFISGYVFFKGFQKIRGCRSPWAYYAASLTGCIMVALLLPFSG